MIDPGKEQRRVCRAIGSLVYNRGLKQTVERRIEKAEDRIFAYMGLRGLEELRLGCYHAWFMDGYIVVEILPGSNEGWMQATYLREEKRGQDGNSREGNS